MSQPNQCWSVLRQGFICHHRESQLQDECLCLNYWVCFAPYSLRFVDSGNKLNWKRKKMLVLCLAQSQAGGQAEQLAKCGLHTASPTPPSRGHVSSAVTWLLGCQVAFLTFKLRGETWTQAFPPLTLPCPFFSHPHSWEEGTWTQEHLRHWSGDWGNIFGDGWVVFGCLLKYAPIGISMKSFS